MFWVVGELRPERLPGYRIFLPKSSCLGFYGPTLILNILRNSTGGEQRRRE
jgi:hypothetical protein